jgi:hypothetical protein
MTRKLQISQFRLIGPLKPPRSNFQANGAQTALTKLRKAAGLVKLCKKVDFRRGLHIFYRSAEAPEMTKAKLKEHDFGFVDHSSRLEVFIVQVHGVQRSPMKQQT